VASAIVSNEVTRLMDLRSFLNTPRSSAINPDRIAVQRGGSGIIVASIAMTAFAALFWVVRSNRSEATTLSSIA
jgi:hypothetical protein